MGGGPNERAKKISGGPWPPVEPPLSKNLCDILLQEVILSLKCFFLSSVLRVLNVEEKLSEKSNRFGQALFQAI